MPEQMTAPKVRAMKAAGQAIVCVTAYDAPTAEVARSAGVDVVLVGDSVGNVVLGYDTTIPVTLEDMLHHTRAVARVCKGPLVVADLPFGSYQASSEQAVLAACALVKAGAQAVKLEGRYTESIALIAMAGIPVMGHLGMTPQSVHAFGGFRVQGKGKTANRLKDDALALDQAGAFAIVLELIPSVLAQEITHAVACPTIGIGAGPHCDGQIQVFHDLVGLGSDVFRHAKRYANARTSMVRGLKRYASEVREREFPTEEHSF